MVRPQTDGVNGNELDAGGRVLSEPQGNSRESRDVPSESNGRLPALPAAGSQTLEVLREIDEVCNVSCSIFVLTSVNRSSVASFDKALTDDQKHTPIQTQMQCDNSCIALNVFTVAATKRLKEYLSSLFSAKATPKLLTLPL